MSLRCHHLSKYFFDGEEKIVLFENLTWSLESGVFAAIFGQSGSGKSTLLHCLAGLEQPSNGYVSWENAPLDTKHILKHHRHTFGFVFQQAFLLPDFNVMENVAMAGRIAMQSSKSAQQQAEKLLTELGLKKRMYAKIATLSGGERQRVAIARALMNEPKCLFADEPTAHLDEKTAQQFLKWLGQLQQSRPLSVLLATHDPMVKSYVDQIWYLQQQTLQEREYGV